jgi:hypothetical protein
MGRLAKFWFMARREKTFLCEAGILLLLSNAFIKAIAFRRIDRFLRARWINGSEGRTGEEQEIRLVRRSISRAANVLPWRSLCLSRSIAEFIMLRRRGIQAILLAGAKFSDRSSLDAHAWVETGLANDKSSENSGFATVIRIGTKGVDQ